MKSVGFMPQGSRVCIVKIYGNDNRNPSGTMQSQYTGETFKFESLSELLLTMDALYDQIGSPQRSMTPRAEPKVELKETQAPSGKPIATFSIDVLFRQNASWQGNLLWVGGDREAQFRSVLELISILDEALAEADKAA